MRDYRSRQEIITVILEMCGDVARRAREAKKIGRTITFGLGYSKEALGGGFQRSYTLTEPTNDTLQIYDVCKQLLDTFYAERPARQLSVSITNLEPEYSL